MIFFSLSKNSKTDHIRHVEQHGNIDDQFIEQWSVN